ncbi:hypothetical protein K503DRAFT_774340 [Rhizopogon vinicolor AM-OR11-026]|uniref:Uncharacterized protein n=1 Tax=Rhizopogon vinicolor AM-OR11-026 TaxID=1314800 RepID=A0A1B7MPW6_9AGAM|nr:hypothetical protein K503DRAFT_774340 [Rhizopogon vinicolor AM-OR11-026]
MTILLFNNDMTGIRQSLFTHTGTSDLLAMPMTTVHTDSMPVIDSGIGKAPEVSSAHVDVNSIEEA